MESNHQYLAYEANLFPKTLTARMVADEGIEPTLFPLSGERFAIKLVCNGLGKRIWTYVLGFQGRYFKPD